MIVKTDGETDGALHSTSLETGLLVTSITALLATSHVFPIIIMRDITHSWNISVVFVNKL